MGKVFLPGPLSPLRDGVANPCQGFEVMNMIRLIIPEIEGLRYRARAYQQLA